MTDAAAAITEEAVERFVDAYLRTLGAEIDKNGRRWTVTLPPDADTEVELDDATLVVTTEPDDVDAGEIALAPGSAFVEQLFEEAAEKCPTGTLALTGDDVPVRFPDWLKASSVDVVNHSFTPYYDRRAICALFHVGIETVSEYESDELHSIAVDLDDHESRPRLAKTYLDLAERTNGTISSHDAFDSENVLECLKSTRKIVENNVAPIIDETRRRATRASGVELEEYREYATQRRNELNTEIDRLGDRIEEITGQVDTASEQSERVEALRKRKKLRAEREKLREERDELQMAIEAGFPERRREVRDRHALTVRIRPVTLTGVTYERGDLEVRLDDGETTVTETFPFAVGTGILDEQYCGLCGTELSKENPLALDDREIRGEDCC